MRIIVVLWVTECLDLGAVIGTYNHAGNLPAPIPLLCGSFFSRTFIGRLKNVNIRTGLLAFHQQILSTYVA